MVLRSSLSFLALPSVRKMFCHPNICWRASLTLQVIFYIIPWCSHWAPIDSMCPNLAPGACGLGTGLSVASTWAHRDKLDQYLVLSEFIWRFISGLWSFQSPFLKCSLFGFIPLKINCTFLVSINSHLCHADRPDPQFLPHRWVPKLCFC